MNEIDRLRALHAEVTKMRERQKAYFANRRAEDLDASRKHEREVDRLLLDLKAPQGSLF